MEAFFTYIYIYIYIVYFFLRTFILINSTANEKAMAKYK
jgi:hypothetical protein